MAGDRDFQVLCSLVYYTFRGLHLQWQPGACSISKKGVKRIKGKFVEGLVHVYPRIISPTVYSTS